MNDRDPLLHELMAHDAWVRALARRLVADAHEADDVAQQAWVEALGAPPPQLPRARAWLRSVVRNAARMRGRTDARRLQRERRAAKPERMPSVAEIQERVELRHRVSRAVFALDEPYRSAILQRYFEGMPPRDIARLSGASPSAIEGRLRRGIEMLRARLDREFGDRGRWAALLLPIAGGAEATVTPAAATLIGTSLMSITTKVGLAAVVLLLVGAFALWSPEDVTPPSPPTDGAGSGVEEPALVEQRTSDASTTAPPDAPPPRPTTAIAAPTRIEMQPVVGAIVGIVQDANGRPISGALVRALDATPGAIEPACVCEARTDSQGAYRLRPLDGRCILDVGADGYYGIRRVAHPFTREDVTLGEPGALAGRVRCVGRVAEPCVGATISLHETRPTDVLENVAWAWWHSLRRHPSASVRADAAGVYRFAGLKPGSYVIRVSHPDHPSRAWRESPVRILAGHESRRDVVLGDGLLMHGRVTDRGTGAPIANAEIVFWSHPRKNTVTDTEGRFRVRGIDWEVHEQVRVRAPGYVQASFYIQHHEFGVDFEKSIALRRGTPIRGRVVGPDGTPVAGARIGTHRFVGDECLARDLGSETIGRSGDDGTFDVAVLPSSREVRLHASAAGFAWGASEPVPIRGTTGADDVLIRLPAGGSIEGTVTNDAGNPVPGCAVLVHGDHRVHRRAVTRDDGRYAVAGVRAGCYLVEIRPPPPPRAAPGLARERMAGVVVDDGRRRELDVTLRRGARIAGRIVAATGEPLEGVVVRATEPASGNLLFAETATHATVSDAAGHFELVGLDAIGTSYSLLAGKPGFRPAGMKGVATGRNDVTLTLVPVATLEGRVHDGGSGQPVESFRIAVVRTADTGYRGPLAPQHAGGRLTFADGEGRFSIELKPGRYDVSAHTASGRRSDPVSVDVVGAGPLPAVRLAVWDGATLRGSLSAAKPFHHAVVGVWDVSVAPPKSVRFDRVEGDGAFTMRALPAGDYVVEVIVPGRALATVVPVSLVVGTVRDLELTLRPCASLQVTVCDDQGTAIPGASIAIDRDDRLAVARKLSHTRLHDRLFKESLRAGRVPDKARQAAIDDEVERRLSRTDDRGRVVDWLLVPGDYTVRVRADGYRAATARVDVTGARDRAVTVTLQRAR